MLGKTAGGLFWMFRNMERSENTARLVDAGFRIALTRSSDSEHEWASVVTTAGCRDAYLEHHEGFTGAQVVDFLLRDRANPASVLSILEAARNNARLVRTALTREVWEATNECWLTVRDALAGPVGERELPTVLGVIRQQGSLVRGALHGTMLRNDTYNFARIGTFLERADSTARILDVKYYVLLPSASHVGSTLDNVHWETILRAVSAQRAYRWLHPGEITAADITQFLILDRRLPRSLIFCCAKILNNLGHLESEYGESHASQRLAEQTLKSLEKCTVHEIFDAGLHEFILEFIRSNNALGSQIERDYRFAG